MARTAYVNGSGTTLTASYGTDYGTPRVSAVSPSTRPTYRINGGPAREVGLAVWSDPAKELTGVPCVTYVLPVPVWPGDSVTVTVPPGAVTLESGADGSVSGLSCVNYSGASVLSQSPPAGRRMKVGFMAGCGSYWAPVSLYADWVRGGTPNWKSDTDPAKLPGGDYWDSSGMPRRPAPDWSKLVVGSSTASGMVGGYPLTPSSSFVLRYRNVNDAYLYANGLFPSDDPGLRTTVGGWSYRYYPHLENVAGQKTPAISVVVNSLGNEDADVEFYDGTIADPTAPPKFHPLVLAQLAGAHHFRFKDAQVIDEGCPIATPADYTPDGGGTQGGQRAAGRVGVVRFDPYQNAPYARPGVIDHAVKVTTAAPHGLAPGQFVGFFFTGNGIDKALLTFRLADGSSQPYSLSNAQAYPLDATSFVVVNTYLGQPIVTSTPPAGSVVVRKWAGMPAFDPAEFVNDADIPVAWVSVPHAMTDQGVTDLFAGLAARLAPGKGVRLEYSNEPWNWGGGYPQFHHFEIMGWEHALARQAAGDPSWLPANGGDPRAYYYVMRAGQIRELARAAFQAAGRDPDAIELVLGGWLSSPNSTSQYVQYCDRMDTQGRRPTDPGYAGPIPFEALAVAPYQSTWPVNDTLTPSQYAGLTLEQVMDVGDAFMHHVRATEYGAWLRGHRLALDASSRPGTRLLSYEGGLKQIGLGGTGVSRAARVIAAAHHPRSRGLLFAHLALCDECGVLEYTQNASASVYETENITQVGGIYVGLGQRAGRGDGSDGGTDNRPYLADPATGLVREPVDLVPGGEVMPSPLGQAFNDWNAQDVPPPSAATAYSVTPCSPASGPVGRASTPVRVEPNGAWSGTVTPHTDGGGHFVPSSLVWEGTSGPKYLAYVPDAVGDGSHALTFSASPALGTNPAGFAYVVTSDAATSYSVVPPDLSGPVGRPSGQFAVTPDGRWSGSVLPATDAAGHFTPPELAWVDEGGPKYLTYVPDSADGSPHALTFSATPPLGSDPAAFDYAVLPVPAGSYTVEPPTTLSGQAGSRSGVFRVRPDGAWTGYVYVRSSEAGTFDPPVLHWSAEAGPKDVTYTPSSADGSPHVISFRAVPSIGGDPQFFFTVLPPPATSCVVTPPADLSGPRDVASGMFLLKPNGVWTGRVTPASDEAGTFTPPFVTWSATSAARGVVYTPSSADGSPHTLTFEAVPPLPVSPGSLSYVVTPGRPETAGCGHRELRGVDVLNGPGPWPQVRVPYDGPAAPVFDRVVVSRLIHGGTTVLWELVPEFVDCGPYLFQLEFGNTANPAADDWLPVGAPVTDGSYAVDTQQRVFGTTDWGFYRVRLTTASGEYVSDPVNALGTLPWRDWCIAREVTRKERLLARLSWEDGYLLKRRFAGPNCPRCVDPQTRAPRDPDCPVCFGTGKECGYFAPMPGVWAGLSPRASHIQLDGGAGRGTVDNDTGVVARMLMVPLMIETDVWVSRRKDDRYFVHKVQHVAEWRGVPLVGQVELRPIPFTSQIYHLQMPGQAGIPEYY